MSDENLIVTSYQVEVGDDRARLTLESSETPNSVGGKRIGMVEYSPGATPSQFTTRGGFLSITRPIELLVPTLDLLRNESPVYLHDDGTIATVAEAVGEGDDDSEPASPSP